MIIVVDGSTDGTLELLQDIAIAEWRLRVHPVPNGGELRARAIGPELARGDVVPEADRRPRRPGADRCAEGPHS